MTFIRSLLQFAWLQALCCIFPVVIFGTLALTKVVSIPGLHRYDLILLICLLAQVGMVVFKLETMDELKVICVVWNCSKYIWAPGRIRGKDGAR